MFLFDGREDFIIGFDASLLAREISRVSPFDYLYLAHRAIFMRELTFRAKIITSNMRYTYFIYAFSGFIRLRLALFLLADAELRELAIIAFLSRPQEI